MWKDNINITDCPYKVKGRRKKQKKKKRKNRPEQWAKEAVEAERKKKEEEEKEKTVEDVEVKEIEIIEFNGRIKKEMCEMNYNQVEYIADQLDLDPLDPMYRTFSKIFQAREGKSDYICDRHLLVRFPNPLRKWFGGSMP